MEKAHISKVDFIEIEQFISNPTPDFAVQACGQCFYVYSNPDHCLVLVDDLEISTGKVFFENSQGRKIKTHNLWEYTQVRKDLLSKKIYLMASGYEESSKASSDPATCLKVLKQFLVCFDGSDPFIKWEMERGLDWTISSVAGESYKVDIDFSEVLQTLSERTNTILSERGNRCIIWRDASFKLKYSSDALFDFPFWFGFSKRRFKISSLG